MTAAAGEGLREGVRKEGGVGGVGWWGGGGEVPGHPIQQVEKDWTPIKALTKPPALTCTCSADYCFAPPVIRELIAIG